MASTLASTLAEVSNEFVERLATGFGVALTQCLESDGHVRTKPPQVQLTRLLAILQGPKRLANDLAGGAVPAGCHPIMNELFEFWSE